MATTRNGHNLMDIYNPETKTSDIRSNRLYPPNVLDTCEAMDSILTDGVRQYGGISAIVEEKVIRQATANMQHEGWQCRKMSVASLQTGQIVWWNVHTIDRQGEYYQQLILRDV